MQVGKCVAADLKIVEIENFRLEVFVFER